MKNRSSIATVCIVLILIAASAGAKEHRVDISTALLTNLAQGHGGDFMGATFGADYFFSEWAGLKTTVGFTKERYYPAELDYRDANYGFWLSVAPVVQANLGGTLKPYVAFLGTISGVGQDRTSGQPLVDLDRSPVRNLGPDRFNSQTLFSLGATAGTKLHLTGPVSVFGEVTHYFYSNVSGAENYYTGTSSLFGRPLDFERNPTYLSIGLTYSLTLGKTDNSR